MTKEEKFEFVSNIIESIKLSLLEKVERMPPTWDGHEIRLLIAEEFAFEVGAEVKTTRRNKHLPVNRVKAYRRDRFNYKV